mmetsp:Transcript_45780/g.109191  ORF Transcript_45780/g.109191 Transcript_45780/m.109191 type:complete len:210 (-) Transcript_45780:1244-1873(-)
MRGPTRRGVPGQLDALLGLAVLARPGRRRDQRDPHGGPGGLVRGPPRLLLHARRRRGGSRHSDAGPRARKRDRHSASLPPNGRRLCGDRGGGRKPALGNRGDNNRGPAAEFPAVLRTRPERLLVPGEQRQRAGGGLRDGAEQGTGLRGRAARVVLRRVHRRPGSRVRSGGAVHGVHCHARAVWARARLLAHLHGRRRVQREPHGAHPHF